MPVARISRRQRLRSRLQAVLGVPQVWATARICIYSADLKMLPNRLGPPTRSWGESNCFNRHPSPASRLMGSDRQFEEDALEKAVLKNTKSEEDQKCRHIHIGRKHAVSARRSHTGGAGGSIRELYGGAEDFLTRDRRLTQAARVEDTPRCRVGFLSLAQSPRSSPRSSNACTASLRVCRRLVAATRQRRTCTTFTRGPTSTSSRRMSSRTSVNIRRAAGRA